MYTHDMHWDRLLELYQTHHHRNGFIFIPTTFSVDNIGQAITSLANTQGGILCIGIDFRNFPIRHNSAKNPITPFLCSSIVE